MTKPKYEIAVFISKNQVVAHDANERCLYIVVSEKLISKIRRCSFKEIRMTEKAFHEIEALPNSRVVKKAVTDSLNTWLANERNSMKHCFVNIDPLIKKSRPFEEAYKRFV